MHLTEVATIYSICKNWVGEALASPTSKLFYRLVQQSVEVPPTLIKDIAGDQSRK